MNFELIRSANTSRITGETFFFMRLDINFPSRPRRPTDRTQYMYDARTYSSAAVSRNLIIIKKNYNNNDIFVIDFIRRKSENEKTFLRKRRRRKR